MFRYVEYCDDSDWSSPRDGELISTLDALETESEEDILGVDQEEDDPYEYDDDIRPGISGDISSPVERLRDDPRKENILFIDGIPLNNPRNTFSSSATNTPASSSSSSNRCWGCQGCSGGTPLFLLTSPAEAPCACQSCQ